MPMPAVKLTVAWAADCANASTSVAVGAKMPNPLSSNAPETRARAL